MQISFAKPVFRLPEIKIVERKRWSYTISADREVYCVLHSLKSTT